MGPAEKLWGLTSFLKADDIDTPILHDEIVGSSEILIGAYFNRAEDFIVLTSGGIHWIKSSKHREIQYTSVVDVNADLEELCLELLLDNGELVKIPIINETDGVQDIETFEDFMCSVVYWPLGTNNFDSIAAIESRDDLIQHLAMDDAISANYPDTIRALRAGFPSFAQLTRLGITPDLLNQPETWRLLGLFLSIRQTWKALDNPYRDNKKR
jgi:hypothetical protein